MKDAAKCCDCALEESRSVLSTPSQRRIKGKIEERLEDALELSKQKVASLISRNEQLENQLTETKETFQRLKNDLKDEVYTLRQENDRCQKDFLNENKIMEEKHNLEIEKILLVEERKRGKLRKELEKEHETARNNILRDINNQQDTNANEQIRTLKDKHVTDVKKLKQNFCDKLEKISQAKAKWMKEEETKRVNAQEEQAREFDIKLLGMQEKYENQLDTQNKKWKTKFDKAIADHKNDMLRLKDEHLFAMNRLTEEHDVSRLKFENDKKNSNRELNAKQQELNLARTQYQQMMVKVKSLEDASIFDSQSESSISPPTNHKSPTMKFNQSPAPPLSSFVDNAANKKEESVSNMKSIEDLRTFYLQSIKNIQDDVVTYTKAMRQKCDHEIREAVRRERKALLHKINNSSKKKESLSNDGQSQEDMRRKSTRDSTTADRKKL